MGWLRRLRGAIGMGVSWAIAWGLMVFALGFLSLFVPGIELIFEAADDELLSLMLVSGFAGGVVFSGVLRIAGGRRRFDELSVPQFAAWGALGGLILPLVPALGGLAEGNIGLAQAAAIVATTSVLGAISATGTLWLARMSEDRALLDASDAVDEAGLNADETRELLGG